MKVVVTGGSGFIGSHLVTALLARGHEVTVVVRDRARAQGMPWFSQVACIEADIHRLADGTLDELAKADALVHLAWSDLSNYQDAKHVEHTLPEDGRFLRTLVEKGLSHLLVTGTCFEYGMQSGSLAEDAPSAPFTPYAIAKDSLRKYLQALGERSTFTLQWARLFYMYGPGQNPRSLLAQAEAAITRGDESFNMSAGEQLRDYLPVEEVARRLACLLEHPQCTGVVNVCGGQPISVRRLVEQYMEARGAHVRLNLGYYPYPKHEPMAFWGDPAKYLAHCGDVAD